MRAGGTFPYVVAVVNGVQLAVSAEYVQEIIRTPRWHEVPNVPGHIRGVINLRGKVIPLVDLRLRLGMSSALEDVERMVAMLAAREQDHVQWLQELREAVTTGRPFTLPRDPSACAFGKWYYSYRAEDIGFASVIARIEMPHRRIHDLANAVLELAEQGEPKKAKELILRAEQGDLQTVVRLFSEARTAFRESQKEVALVLAEGGKHLATTVDSVASVEAIAEKTITDATPAMTGVKPELLNKVAQKANDAGVVFVLDARALLAGRDRLSTGTGS